ncbi:MAG: acylphosphatase [Chloroflexota bacterium]|nr:acylphosphatase [Chloroflexota bacterium]
MTDRQRLVARISGRVQGVGFRYWTQRQAVSMGLVGWVMNLDAENAVELVAEGEPVALDALERLVRRGPPGARVERVEVLREPASGEFSRFSIMRQ